MNNDEAKFEEQFRLRQIDYLMRIDFIDWYRYFFLLKEVVNSSAADVLEIGAGSGIIKRCAEPIVKSYTVLDVNPELRPDVLADIRTHRPELIEKFDCVIAADVLEHIPFSSITDGLSNIHSYLRNGGKALITIPHRRSHFLFMTPTQKPHVLTVPAGFLSPGSFYRRFIKRRIWIDPHHCWEIGDGHVKPHQVESLFMQVGFQIKQFSKLLYVDFWVLKKSSR